MGLRLLPSRTKAQPGSLYFEDDSMARGSLYGNGKGRNPWRASRRLLSLPCILTVGLIVCFTMPSYFTVYFMNYAPAESPLTVSSDDDESSSFDAPLDEMDETVLSRLQPPSYDSETCRPSFLEKLMPETEYDCDEMKRILEDDAGELIGEGYWREVYKVDYKGRELVYKKLASSQHHTKRNKERHRWEAAALHAVKGHENVVDVLGVCSCDVVTEFFPYTMDVLLFEQEDELPIDMVLEMALDAARGLAALHSVEGGPIVHSDLQPRQLLLDRHGVVKINDLNRCRFMYKDAQGRNCPFYIRKSGGVWRSPEEYAGEGLTEKLDVYSMSMIYWSMLARRPPFKKDKVYKERVINGERPEIDPSWHPGFVKVIEDMWKPRPEERVSMSEVADRLQALLDEQQRQQKWRW